ncbi:MAG TPA: hypothetical protein VNS88_02575 [Nitrospiraceae bacterium]|nr:hypothetical protein [Nitrospiraceae bacterium]
MDSDFPPIDLQYADVKCKECGKEYTCTPDSDYFNATTTTDGVCWDCLTADVKGPPQAEEEAPVVSADEMIGISLKGGPPMLDGWKNAYSAAELWGWPPPDEIMAFHIGGKVAVAMPENVPAEMKGEMTLYRKVKQSTLPEPGPDSHYFRGAEYEVVTND